MSKKHSQKSNFFATTSLIIAVAVVVAAAILLGTKLSKQCPSSEIVSAEPTFLYVQTAHSGTLSAQQADGRRILKLNNVSPTTVYFSDRPSRITGHESTAEFIAEWNSGEDSFEVNPPNAALDVVENDSQSIAIVELMKAKYDASTRVLEYEVVILDDKTDGNIPESFDEAALFIDSTFKKYHCGCELEPGKKDCVCSHKYHLKRSQTKEFRGYCTASSLEPARMSISGKNKSTTCTTDILMASYNTRSCTNWSPTSGDDITVKIHCSKDIPL